MQAIYQGFELASRKSLCIYQIKKKLTRKIGFFYVF